MNQVHNQKLFEVVSKIYDELIAEWREKDVNSAEFLNSIEACFSNSIGGDLEYYLCRTIEDFLNYIVPRTIGLPSGREIFQRSNPSWKHQTACARHLYESCCI